MFGKPPSYPPLPADDLKQILHQTSSLWEEARGKSFFITGGTGFFGIWLLESFVHINEVLGLNAKATVLTRDPSAFLKKVSHLADRADLQFVQGDVRTFSFPAGNFDYLIHAATEASAKLNNENPEEMLDSIIAGMRHTLDFAAHARVGKLLFTSSGAVYGPQPSHLTHVPEDYTGGPDPTISSSAYGEGKRVSELMAAIHAQTHPCDMKIARCWAFVGPGLPLDAHFAVGNFIRDGLAGRPIKIGGDGTPIRSYLYAADLASWLWTILFQGKSLRPYNVGSAEDLSISELAKLVSHTLDNSLPVEIAQTAIPGAAPIRYVPSVDRAENELGLRSLIPLAESIRRTITWHRASSF